MNRSLVSAFVAAAVIAGLGSTVPGVLRGQAEQASIEGCMAYATDRQSPDRHGLDSLSDADVPVEPLADFEFLVGTWRGERDGGLVEEIWSEARGGAMMGMFRWLNADGEPRLYELLTISREGDETLLRLRHFSSEFIAWEEKDSPIVLALAESAHGRKVFVNRSSTDRLERIVFEQAAAEELSIDVVFREESGFAPLTFRFRAARDRE